MSIETMTKLATITIGATSQSSIEFTNIPQTYTDLKVVLSARTDRADYQDDLAVQFNSDSTSGNHSWVVMWGNNSTGQSGTNTSDAYGHGGWVNAASATSSTFGSIEIYFPNYTGNVYKTSSGFSNTENNSSTANQSLIAMASNLYRSSAPITSLKFFSRSSTSYKFVQYTTATLYGIRNARRTVGNSIKATGGNISFDGTYVTHTFISSGTFTPAVSLLADYLVVAGGGGGGNADGTTFNGGGGGAGGLRCTVGTTGGGGTPESKVLLTAANQYAITIGAGGGSNSIGSNSSIYGTGVNVASSGGGRGKGSNFDGDGGSGGGGRNLYSAGGAGTTNQGYAGGSASGENAGGGGGAGAAGGNGSGSGAGNGGAGVAIAISGSSVTYAGGGGGGAATPGSGGAGGGGAGGNPTGTAGTANTGGGGGGVRDNVGATPRNGASGGSGIVIIRYKA